MKRPSRLIVAYKALRELGIKQVGLNLIYKLGIATGHYHRQLNSALSRLGQLNTPPNLTLHPCLTQLPDRDALRSIIGDQIPQLYAQADEIVAGNVRLFGGQPVPLVLNPPGNLKYWSEYEGGSSVIGDQDIKFIWEPARFGWACTLARAYYLSGDEKYADSFWKYTEHFLTANPPYQGPHWASAQEVAIRLVSLVFSYQVFKDSIQSTPARAENLARSISIHAERIPATMVYTRSQNNNHLLTEALGLYTAAALLPEHPLASKWHALGWKWLQYAFRTQIDPDGTYVQQSTNYHRLMLQAALWMVAVHAAAFVKEPIPDDLESKLAVSTNWLWKLTDPETGHVPNLGHNDGAYFLPLTTCSQDDYRPVIYAASRTFLHSRMVPEGSWDEMSVWLCPPPNPPGSVVKFSYWRGSLPIKTSRWSPPTIIQNRINGSWCSFRVVSFHSRPAHADQLNIDLWWRGINLAQDPGTYLYNSSPPWDNSLTHACVHNTVTIDGLDFMDRVSKFLYLDWAQGTFDDTDIPMSGPSYSLTATHNGYRKIGVKHTRRIVVNNEGHWEIYDSLEGRPPSIHTVRLHWLLPDCEYEIVEGTGNKEPIWYGMRFRTSYGWVTVNMGEALPVDKTISLQNVSLQLVRAGKLVYGSGEANLINGWYSPTYGEKIPALSCILEVTHSLPVMIMSRWILPS
jgi:hypothetical protein